MREAKLAAAEDMAASIAEYVEWTSGEGREGGGREKLVAMREALAAWAQAAHGGAQGAAASARGTDTEAAQGGGLSGATG